MSVKLNIESQTAKHEQCLMILDMIERNRKYMLSDIKESTNPFWITTWGSNHYQQRVELRKKIQNRLICYYAKKVAVLSSEPYEVAMAIREPKQSPIQSQ